MGLHGEEQGKLANALNETEVLILAQPSFTLSTILPDVNWGRMFPGFGQGSGAWILALSEGKSGPLKALAPRTYPTLLSFLSLLIIEIDNFTGWFIDVADTALLHVVVLLDPSVVSERIWIAAAPYSYREVVQAVLKVRPDAPLNESEFETEKPQVVIDNTRARALLEPYGGFKSLETSIGEALE